jgi:SRSO17 transposase
MQRLLRTARWDADAVRDDIRRLVVEYLGHRDGVLVIDETVFLKKEELSPGVQRQYANEPGISVDDCEVQMIGLKTKNRAQRFPDHHISQGKSATELTPQVSNAVPVNAAYRPAQRVLPSLS